MPHFYVIGDESTVSGFGLAGVEGQVVETVDEARAALKKAFSSPDVGVIIIPERLAEGMRADVEAYIFGRSFPLVVESPDRNGPMEGRVSIQRMVRAAVGISV
jgi:V/A-type H+-transporting ATPase subunit F